MTQLADDCFAFGGRLIEQPLMTNVLAGSYPEVFEAGAAYSGVAHACFLGMFFFFVYS